MIKTALMEDMLASIKRLNEELDSRCNFESGLITRIDELQKVIKTKDKQIAKLNSRLMISHSYVQMHWLYVSQ